MFKHGFPPEWSTLKKLIWLVGSGIAGAASGIWKTVTGTLIHITDALASPMQKCEVTLEPVQAGSGDPSPTNVRPITGWTGCEVTRTGSNQFDKSTAVVGEGLNTSGGTVSSQTSSRSDYIKVVPNTQYRKIFDVADGVGRLVQCFDAEKNFIDYLLYNNTSADAVFTTPANCFFVRIAFPTSQIDNVRLIFASSGQSTDYEPYSGTTLSATFPDTVGTVYGGTVDLVSGVLTVDMVSVDMGRLAWNYTAASSSYPYGFFNVPISNPKKANGVTNIICSTYPVGNLGFSVDNHVQGNGTNNQVYCIDSAYTDKTTFKNAMSGVQLVYELAEPTEIQLTPQEISTLKGVNNVWSNSNGETTLIYKAQAE